MRHERRMVDEAFNAAETFRQREQLGVLEKTPRSRKVRLQNDGDHATETAHLLAGQIVLRMRFEAGIMHRFDLALFLEPARNLQRVSAMPLPAERQRFQPAQDKKT